MREREKGGEKRKKRKREKKRKKENSRKSVRWAAYPLPLCECMWMCDSERGSGPEGGDDLCFHTGEISPPPPSPPSPPSVHPLQSSYPSCEAQILVSRSKFLLQGPNSSLEAQISASRLKSQPQGPNISLDDQISTLRPKS